MRIFSFIAFLSLTFGYTQQTLQLSSESVIPKADLSVVEWMAGHWRGEAFGGITEEIWAPPMGGSMMFSFRLISDNKVGFYELGHIREVDDTLVYELKHFNDDMTSWEEKEEVQQFKLVKVEEDKVFFEGFTFQKVNDNEVIIYAQIGDDKKGPNEVTFKFKRYGLE